jgi:cobyrinic acid a,c-diamide synthase
MVSSRQKSSEQSQKKVVLPRIFLAGASNNIGVSTIGLGLIVAFRKAGLSVGSAKVGNSLVDTAHFRRVSGRFSHTLDPWMLQGNQIKNSLARLSSGCELAVIVGDEALFDAKPRDFTIINEAELAAELQAPVILVVDCRGYSSGISALVHGFSSFNSNLKFGGVIANFVKSDEQILELKTAINSLGIQFFGGIPEGEIEKIEHRASEHNLGNRSLMSRNRMLGAGEMVKNYLDLSLMQKVAESAEPFFVKAEILASANRCCRVAVADDAAFHLTIQDNFDLIRRSGGELVSFSPLADQKLPSETSAIYFPSGFVDIYLEELSKNKSLLNAIRNHVERGGTIYAEGNALVYLARQGVLPNGMSYPLADILPGKVALIEPPTESMNITYCEVENASPSVIGEPGLCFRAMRESRLVIRLEGSVIKNYQVTDRRYASNNEKEESPRGSISEGLSPSRRVITSVVQAHWGSNEDIVRGFIASALTSKQDLADSHGN